MLIMQLMQTDSTLQFMLNFFIQKGRRIYLILDSGISRSRFSREFSSTDIYWFRRNILTLSSIIIIYYYPSLLLSIIILLYIVIIDISYLMQCCPEGSLPQLKVDYAPKGEKLNIEGVVTYHIGQGKRVLFLVEDIFGVDSGRHRVIADIFASKGYNVFMPEFLDPIYDGPAEMGPIVANIKSQNVENMDIKASKVLGHIKSSVGVDKMLSIGFCWGTWYAFKMSVKYDCFTAIAGPHPSLVVQGIYGGNPLTLAEQVKCPAFLLPAGNDPDEVKEKGSIVEALSKKFGNELTGTVHFPDMMHGWTTRGDLNDEKTNRDFHKSLHLMQEYLAKFK